MIETVLYDHHFLKSAIPKSNLAQVSQILSDIVTVNLLDLEKCMDVENVWKMYGL